MRMRLKQSFKRQPCSAKTYAVKEPPVRSNQPRMRPLSPRDSSKEILKSSSDSGPMFVPGDTSPAPGAVVPMRYEPPASFYNTKASVSIRNRDDGPAFRPSMMVAGFEADSNEPEVLPADATQFSWAREDYSRTQRTIQTWSFVLSLRARLFLLDAAWSYPGGMTVEKKSKRARSLGAWIRESLLALGPTFIKIGQLFSTRSDLLSLEFVEELSKLQDRVPAFDPKIAVAIVERELGAPIGELFEEFEMKPLAAASLGQVHRARLQTGEEVVVKVQRPGLKRLFDIDLENLRDIAAVVDSGEEAERQGRDLTGIYNECASILLKEIEYLNEGRNAARFSRNFKNTTWIKVPRVFWQLSSPSVLTLEYVPGIKITDTKSIKSFGLDTSSLARRATESYLLQILRHGFFHADPHPGNIAVEASTGTLIFYDFGMMGEIVPTTRDRLVELFSAIARKDADSALSCLIDLEIIVPTGDRGSLKKALAFFLDNINKQVERNDAVAQIGEDLFTIALDQPFRFPAAFTFVLRAFATLEGIGKALDPNYSFAAVATPYASELLELGDAQQQQAFAFNQLSAQAQAVGVAAAAMPFRIEKIEGTLGQIESGDVRLRVRVLEAERAARRAGVMQLATLNSVMSVGLLNIGTQFVLSGKTAAGGILFGISAVFAGFVLWGMRRVKRLDVFEQELKGGFRR